MANVKNRSPEAANSHDEPLAIKAIEIRIKERAAIQKMGRKNFGLFFFIEAFNMHNVSTYSKAANPLIPSPRFPSPAEIPLATPP